MNNDNNNSKTGIGFMGLLTLLFIGLKLTNYITWSWIWVLSPIWLPVVVGVIVLIVITVVLQRYDD